ncbi:uncharacterized protein JCM15063_001002 [Sporobolomyces koalae]|uniref:uncharacterized protein n=1 Tax=Sporobolomyces koalae TaxID=500713 RepID=UPI00317FE87E
MLPWNPPSSFSLSHQSQGSEPPRYGNYSNEQPPPFHQQQPQQHQPQQQHFQQQQQQQQQQNLQQGQAPSAYPPMTLASTLHFLQSEHRRYARDRNEWEIERAEMRARIALLEGEKRGNEGALKSLARRCKMLEMALRGERSKFLSTTNALASNASPSASGTASPIPGGSVSIAPGTPSLNGPVPNAASIKLPSEKDKDLISAIAPAKLASLQKETADVKSAAMAPSTSSPGVVANATAPTQNAQPSTSNPAATNGVTAGTGTWGLTMGGTLGGRDPRGKARSRDYLKQCLQEITYLTSSTTLNPLSTTSYAAPQIPRPRKTLPDHVPPPSVPQPPTTTATSNAPEPAPSTAANNTKIPGMINLAALGGAGPLVNNNTNKANTTSTTDANEPKPVEDSSAPTSIPLATSNGPTDASAFVAAPPTLPSASVSASFDSIKDALTAWGAQIAPFSEPQPEQIPPVVCYPSPSRADDATTTSDAPSSSLESSNPQQPDSAKVKATESAQEEAEAESPSSSLAIGSLRTLSDHVEEQAVADSPQVEKVPSMLSDEASESSQAPERQDSLEKSEKMRRRSRRQQEKVIMAIYQPESEGSGEEMSCGVQDGEDTQQEETVETRRMRKSKSKSKRSKSGTGRHERSKWTEEEKQASFGKTGRKKLPHPDPTSLKVVNVIHKQLVAVNFQNVLVKLDVSATGEYVRRLAIDENSDGTRDAQTNALAIHPTLPILATAHEDRFIRIFDLSSNLEAPTVSTLAHLDGVTSLSFAPTSVPNLIGAHPGRQVPTRDVLASLKTV